MESELKIFNDLIKGDIFRSHSKFVIRKLFEFIGLEIKCSVVLISAAFHLIGKVTTSAINIKNVVEDVDEKFARKNYSHFMTV